MTSEPWSQSLEGRIPQVQREPWLDDLVKRLEKEDYLYPYHVTPSILRMSDNETLFHYLERTYRQELFVIEDPAEIERYARPGDRVVKKGELKELAWLVKQGQPGVVKGKKADTALVKFKEIKELVSVNPERLVVYGKWDWIKNFSFPRELLSKGRYEEWKGLLVEYTQTEELKKYRLSIPDRAEGLITAIIEEERKKEKRFAITWAYQSGAENTMGVEYARTDGGWGYFRAIVPAPTFTGSEIKLIIPNTLNFPQLVEDCRKPYLTDGVPTGSISGNVVAVTVRPADRKP